MPLELPRSDHRYVVERVIVRGILVLDTPTCLGSGDGDSPTDLPLLRDSISDRALLTGASIAGALRNYLREYQQGYDVAEQKCDLATLLFGGIRGDDDGDQSPLIVDDALSCSPDGQQQAPLLELRDGVKINSVTGTAEDQAKYDLELLAAGTEFLLRLELLIEAKQNRSQLLQGLAVALKGLEQGEIGIGMKKRRGFGRCHVKAWQVWKFNLTQPEQLAQWLRFEHWQTGESQIDQQQPEIEAALGIKLQTPDQRNRFVMKATFSLDGSLLIRSGQAATGLAPDVVHLKSRRSGGGEVPVLSGTSLAGVLRHRAERIVNTMGAHTALITAMFGDVDEKTKQSQASRLIVHESEIQQATEPTELVQTRIAIDRFTGGALHGALFEEQPLFGQDETRVTIHLELRQPQDYEIGLLLLLLKDLWTSDLPVGGESSIGRGRLKGIAATLQQMDSGTQKTWTIAEQEQQLQVSDASALERFVESLGKYLKEGKAA